MQNEGFIYGDNLNNDNIHVNGSRTNDCGIFTTPHTRRMEESNNTFDETTTIISDINIQIYRYKFTDEFMNALYIFSKVHQYDHRKVFKEAWEIWIEENTTIVESEVKRLTYLGYEGNILDKMFKSARYYFRKKSTEKKALAERRDYISVEKHFLESMDKHINSGIIQENYKPSDGFDEFCRINLDLLKEQVHLLCKNGFTNSNEIKQKIKKTYKNRYFLAVKQYL
jgi:hypothetical protein